MILPSYSQSAIREITRKLQICHLLITSTVESPAVHSYDLKRLTVRRKIGGGEWTQYLQVTEVNGVRYLDEGNGDDTPAADLATGKK